MNRPIRVLHIVGAMYPGGLENFLMNIYEYTDPERVRFDFAVHVRKEGDYGDRIAEMGGRIHTIGRLMRQPVKSLRRLGALIRENHYDVVVRHTPNALIVPQLLVARKNGAYTICHSHSASDPQKLLHYLGRLWMKRACDGRIACSPEAGRWMFGSADFAVVKNAIDIRQFAYDKEAEDAVRAELGIRDATIYGHIGNFVLAKNHPYLVGIFREILRRDPNAVCILVGEGALRNETEERIREAGIGDRVILTGIRTDTAALLSAFDVLLFPSIYEGIPLTLIEAQAASLPGIISDRIAKEVILTEGLMTREAIEKDPSEWAEQAIGLARLHAGKKEAERVQQTAAIREAGYDAEQAALWYTEYFEKAVRGA